MPLLESSLDPPEQAANNGHKLYFDPGMSCLRWTCSRCGMAAIRCGTNEYGQATEKACTRPLENDV